MTACGNSVSLVIFGYTSGLVCNEHEDYGIKLGMTQKGVGKLARSPHRRACLGRGMQQATAEASADQSRSSDIFPFAFTPKLMCTTKEGD